MVPAAWRHDPALAGRFHPEYPDDLQVIVHDGEPRRSGRGPEACWVRLRAVHALLRLPIAPVDAEIPPKRESLTLVERPVYVGVLLHDPHHLTTARRGDLIFVVTSPGLPHPLQVSEAYLAERGAWSLTPCDRCGADQTLDPMTVMAQTRFPGTPAGAAPLAFSAFCPCGGTMMLGRVDGEG